MNWSNKLYYIHIILFFFSSCNQPNPVYVDIKGGENIFLRSDSSYYFDNIRVFKNDKSVSDYNLSEKRYNQIRLTNIINKSEQDFDYLFIEAKPYNAVSSNPYRYFVIKKEDILMHKNESFSIKGTYH